MAKLDFSLTVVSPAFVAGSMEKPAQTNLRDRHGNIPPHRLIGMDGDGLRPPSLRGVLRFWFRAKSGFANTADLAEKEGEIFGDTVHGQGLRLIPFGQSEWKQPLRIGGKGDFISGGSAKAYLGYGPLNYVSSDEGVSSHNKLNFRDAIPDGTIFHFRATGSDRQIEELKKCLLLVHLFGGIGSRSRRAWGSLAISGADIIPEWQRGTSVWEWFGNTLNGIWSHHERPSRKTGILNYSAFTAESQVRISNPYHNYSEVMNDFYRQFKRTRLYNRNDGASSPPIARSDHDLEFRDSPRSNIDLTDVPRRLAFGMPYYPKSLRNRWEIEYRGFNTDPNDKGIDRRASPLFLKVFQGPDQKLYAVSLFLKAQFFGDSNIKIGKNSHGKHLPFPDWTAVEEFLNHREWKTVALP